ncbi:unnamed protein product [Zymoseptoria tritici ST99CH_1A5]|uniref:EVE domain-containing protein n=1 Tax=Zymoseptoria tritici ST99CH_1A5 TaxID=1276529 RepID=A0A1Y6LFR5_ZYMTR|nr:unnamed protein product [Zymoseptoria tritici ST99CH_1A5]
MPPKKSKAKAKAKAAPAPAVQAPVPESVTSKRGTEHPTSAAYARPRRESTMVIAPVLANTPKKRGRPANPTTTNDEPAAQRGRPAKKGTATVTSKKRGRQAQDSAAEMGDEEEDEVVEPPKKRGRPAKAKAAQDNEVSDEGEAQEPAPTPVKRGRGRPAKTQPAQDNEVGDEDEVEEAAPTPAKRGPGRPPKASKRGGRAGTKLAPAVPEEETPPPKRRGSSPHGGETTKMDGDDDAAAGQLEDELMGDADDGGTPEPAITATKKGRGGKGKAKMTEEEEEADVSSSGKQYWLMKAEQEDRDETAKSGRVVNTKFTIDDLRSKTAPELWDGVRNATAAKNMRAMKVGDLAFFYASGGKQGRKPGIVGIMEIVKAAEIDQTVYDENSLGYVEKEKDRGRWVAVQVEYRSKLTKPVYLSELQKYKGGSGVLSNMQELTAARLSVSKVSEEEWNFITEKLIEGYEDDEALPGMNSHLTNTGKELEEEANDSLTSNNLNGITDGAKDVLDGVADTATKIVDGEGLPELALPTIENEVPTSDTALPANTSQTSRPTSRASSTKGKAGGSRASSVAKSKVGGSRAGSAAPSTSGLAPPATKGRGRSITPRSRAGSARPAEEAAAMQTIGEE